MVFIDELAEQLAEGLLAEEAIRLAYLFGSVLVYPECRDVDLAVWAPAVDAMTPAARIDCRLRWGAMLERCLRPRRPLDLHLLNGAALPLQYTVVRTGRLILVRNEVERIRYEAGLALAYLDFQPSLRPFEDALLARIG
jgi:predicted nucleotidyltransferase